eukprot:TRINITY_DN16804_c0_g1_i1.p1 TRINITY_DN16804_c0_g1~~TRINITY_DN16804_c0_g1_i1.p1  ORF type:complete len:172 (-),score=50.16 TRINITY_DN16804_c0_g1_i1:106-621(-)
MVALFSMPVAFVSAFLVNCVPLVGAEALLKDELSFMAKPAPASSPSSALPLKALAIALGLAYAGYYYLSINGKLLHITEAAAEQAPEGAQAAAPPAAAVAPAAEPPTTGFLSTKKLTYLMIFCVFASVAKAMGLLDTKIFVLAVLASLLRMACVRCARRHLLATNVPQEQN